MDIHHLRVFLSVFRNKSFSRASEELNLTQPTISSHIKAVEDELDCRLFDRVGRTIIPTKEARLLFLHASEVVENIEKLKTALGLIKEETGGEVVIGASTIPGTYIIPSMVSEFKKKYPDTSFQVIIGDSGKITEMVLNNELLLGVVGARMENKKIEYHNFIEDELILVSSPELLNKRELSMRELRDIPFLIREEGSGTRKMMEKHLSEKGIGIKDMNIVAVLGSTDSVKEAVKSGLGASILSRFAVKSELKAGTLREIKLKGLSRKRTFYIIKHRKRTFPKNYRILFDCLKSAK